MVVAEKATVREDFAMESTNTGYLERGDAIKVVAVRVNEQDQVRVAFEIEDHDHLGWVSMVSTSGSTLLEVVADEWEMARDVDGDGKVTAEEQAQWDAYYAGADLDGDGRVTADELRQRAGGHRHAP